jgi:IS5 family transposase
MEQILPWQNMTAVIRFYPAGNGRRPYPLETMLRIHCMQHWYNLSDGAMEDALYEIASMRLFARLSLDSALPDTTIMNFRHLLEQHQLARQLFKTINRWLAEAGVMMTQGTWWMPPSLRHPVYQEQRAATRSGCIRPRKAISGTLA